MSVIDTQIAKTAGQKSKPLPPKSNSDSDLQKKISITKSFAAMDIRTGTILAAEKVAKTKKLLKLTIDTGIDERTVVSGIAEHYEPEAIIGKKVSIW